MSEQTTTLADVYKALNAARKDMKPQLEKTGVTAHGNAAVTADHMMIEISKITIDQNLYLEMTETKFDPREKPNGGYFAFVTFAFRWVLNGIKTEPEMTTQGTHVHQSTDLGALRTLTWKYFIRTALMIATGDEDLDEYPDRDFGDPKKAKIERKADPQQQLVTRRNNIQTKLINMGFRDDFARVVDWILNAPGNQINSLGEYQIRLVERFFDRTEDLVAKHTLPKFIQSVRTCIQKGMPFMEWIEKAGLAKEKAEPTPEPAPEAPEDVQEDLPPEAYEDTPAPPAPEPEGDKPEPYFVPDTVALRRTQLAFWLTHNGAKTAKQKAHVINWICAPEAGLSMSKLLHKHLEKIERVVILLTENGRVVNLLDETEQSIESNLSIDQWLLSQGLISEEDIQPQPEQLEIGDE